MSKRVVHKGQLFAGSRRADALIAACLMALLALSSLVMPLGFCWADNLQNQDIPTDDTGVVSQPAPEDDAGEEAEESGKDEPAEDAEESADEQGSEENSPFAGGHGDIADKGQQGSDNVLNPWQKPDSSFIYDTSIADLDRADSYMNKQTVQVVGEVVGDRIYAEYEPEYCWITLQANDGSYAEISVFMPLTLAEQIDLYGRYGVKGTTLQVRGVFQLTCPEHEGLTDLHADSVVVVEKGQVADTAPNWISFLPGAGLLVVGVVLLLVFHYMRERQR